MSFTYSLIIIHLFIYLFINLFSERVPTGLLSFFNNYELVGSCMFTY